VPGGLVAVAAMCLFSLERDPLRQFNEGTVQVNVVLPPGTSLETSDEVAGRVEERLMQIDDIVSFVRRTGRAELDEHAVGVNISEIIIELDPESEQAREDILEEIREAMDDI